MTAHAWSLLRFGAFDARSRLVLERRERTGRFDRVVGGGLERDAEPWRGGRLRRYADPRAGAIIGGVGASSHDEGGTGTCVLGRCGTLDDAEEVIGRMTELR